MKNYFKQINAIKIITIIGLIVSITFYYNYFYMDMEKKDRKCLVVDKIMTEEKYSSSFYLILKEERNIVFELMVSAVSYSQTEIGDTKHFILRDFEIKRTIKEQFKFYTVLYAMIAFTLYSFVASLNYELL